MFGRDCSVQCVAKAFSFVFQRKDKELEDELEGLEGGRGGGVIGVGLEAGANKEKEQVEKRTSKKKNGVAIVGALEMSYVKKGEAIASQLQNPLQQKNQHEEDEEDDEYDEGTFDPQFKQTYFTHKKSGRATWTEPQAKKVLGTAGGGIVTSNDKGLLALSTKTHTNETRL
ncbi:hypothetical protein TrLO_g10973 [Triparma laevis f. longispina]|uniref:Uncharacterized protein n=1 Tax=Triparma laevis f. longispina TaxID=1714387 RepID=A0A9W7DTU1_9STRA|nr:hypothetical protein TrLO_g10973 [Triparma laevis f. longispina]